MGKKWRRIFTIQDLFSNERFPNVVVAKDGTVMTSWGSENFRVRSSEDGGKTWGQEITISNPGFQDVAQRTVTTINNFIQ